MFRNASRRTVLSAPISARLSKPHSKPAAAFSAAMLGGVLLLSGCSSTPAPAPNASASPQPSSATPESASPENTTDSTHTSYPLEVDTCGTSTTFTKAPQRVVTAKSTTMEMMLALGVGDRIVGTSYQDGPLPEWLAKEPGATSEPVTTPLSDKLAGTESVLALTPDLVYAGWESNLSADGMGDRAAFEKLGVNTVVAPSACKEADYQPNPLTFDDVFSEIQLAGQIFDVQDQASQLVEKQKKELSEVRKDQRGLTALWYSSGSDTPFVGGGIGSAQLVMDTIGLTNIGKDIADTWGSMSWEKVIEADPDVIILVDSAWGSTEKKIGVLESNPATAKLTAVQNKRYLVVPFPATEAGVRTVSAATDLSAQLAALDVGSQGASPSDEGTK